MISEFTITAMRRPGLLRDTLDSFAQNLKGVDLSECMLFINIDPLPEEVDADSVIAVAEEYFARLIVRTPVSPSFPAAVQWCWRQPRGEFFWHLEDDWIVLEPINVSEVQQRLLDPSISVVNLRAYSHNDNRMCLAPGLWRTEHARIIADRLSLDANPEMQLRTKTPNNPGGGKHDGFKGIQFPRNVVLRDIGRVWLAQMPYMRKGGKKFTAWVKE